MGVVPLLRHLLGILENVGCVFEYDYHTVATHMAAKGKQYNRLFVLSFPDQEIANQYFTSPEYQAIRGNSLMIQWPKLRSWQPGRLNPKLFTASVTAGLPRFDTGVSA